MKYIALIVATVAAAGVASAQEAKPVGLAIKFGQFQPQASSARSEGKRWTMVGVDLKVKDIKYDAGRNEYFTVSFDYAQKGDFRTAPLLLNYVSRNNEWYYYGGAGVSFTSRRVQDGPDTESHDSIELGYQFGVGYDFQYKRSPLFAELKFMGNGQDKLNGVGLSLGVRL
jgi:hypothetical protein